MDAETIDVERGNKQRITPADHPTGHDLIAIDEWVPGTRPTDYAIELTIGPTYHSRFWRCRACGAERYRPDEFESVCPGGPPAPVVTDGGSSTEATDSALPADRATRTRELPGPDGRFVR